MSNRMACHDLHRSWQNTSAINHETAGNNSNPGWRPPLARGALAPNNLLSVRVVCDPTPNAAFATGRSVKPWSGRPIYRTVFIRDQGRKRHAHTNRIRKGGLSWYCLLYALTMAPSGSTPVSRNFHRETRSFLASATIPMRRCRLAPWPKRSRYHRLRPLSG